MTLDYTKLFRWQETSSQGSFHMYGHDPVRDFGAAIVVTPPGYRPVRSCGIYCLNSYLFFCIIRSGWPPKGVDKQTNQNLVLSAATRRKKLRSITAVTNRASPKVVTITNAASVSYCQRGLPRNVKWPLTTSFLPSKPFCVVKGHFAAFLVSNILVTSAFCRLTTSFDLFSFPVSLFLPSFYPLSGMLL